MEQLHQGMLQVLSAKRPRNQLALLLSYQSELHWLLHPRGSLRHLQRKESNLGRQSLCWFPYHCWYCLRHFPSHLSNWELVWGWMTRCRRIRPEWSVLERLVIELWYWGKVAGRTEVPLQQTKLVSDTALVYRIRTVLLTRLVVRVTGLLDAPGQTRDEHLTIAQALDVSGIAS